MNKEYAQQVGESLTRLNLATGMTWEHETTGGGCDGFVFSPVGTNPDAYYLVTMSDGVNAPITADEWDNIALGWYDDDADELPDGFRMIPEVTNLATLTDFFGGK